MGRVLHTYACMEQLASFHSLQYSLLVNFALLLQSFLFPIENVAVGLSLSDVGSHIAVGKYMIVARRS